MRARRRRCAGAVLVRVRGTIVAIDGNTMMVKSRDGRDVRLDIADPLTVAVANAARFEDIKEGDYLGATTQARPDGSNVAVELHYIAPTASPGQSGSDLLPGATMTNANVASRSPAPAHASSNSRVRPILRCNDPHGGAEAERAREPLHVWRWHELGWDARSMQRMVTCEACDRADRPNSAGLRPAARRRVGRSCVARDPLWPCRPRELGLSTRHAEVGAPEDRSASSESRSPSFTIWPSSSTQARVATSSARTTFCSTSRIACPARESRG